MRDLDWNDWKVRANFVTPPDYQLDPKQFQIAKKAMSDNMGKWQTNKQRFKLPYSATTLMAELRKGNNPRLKKDFDYFPTPDPVVDKMLQLVMPFEPVTILEPSAGQGAILDYLKGFMAVEHEMHCIEAMDLNRGVLEEKGYTIVDKWFEDYSTDNKYELILSNPPFSKDIAHFLKMIKHLKRNGSICCVMPSNFMMKNRKAIDGIRHLFESVDYYSVDDKAFQISGTGVSTCIVYAYCYRGE